MKDPNKQPFTLDARPEPLRTGACYTMQGGCTNCGARIDGTFAYGQEAGNGSLGPVCPHCGTHHIYWRRT